MALAGVIVLALGFPMLAMILLSATGAFSPDLLSTLLIGGAVFTFAILAVFEIMRLVELDGHPAGHAVGHAGPSAAGSHHHDAPGAAARAQGVPVIDTAEPQPAPKVPAPVAHRTVEEIRIPEPAAAAPAAPEIPQAISVEAAALDPAPAIIVPEEVAIRTADSAPDESEAESTAGTTQPGATQKPRRKGPAKSQAKSGPKASVAREAVPAKEARRASEKAGPKTKSSRTRGPAKA